MSLLQRSYFRSAEVPRAFLEQILRDKKHGGNTCLFAQVLLPPSSSGRLLVLPVYPVTNPQISECSLG